MNNSDILKSKTAGGVIISACGLWIHIALLSFVMLILGLYLTSESAILIIILFLLCQYECLRLNLDSQLFKILYENPDETENFDAGLICLFNKKQNNRSVEERWQGTKKILRNAIFWLSAQIITLVIYLILMNQCFICK